MNPGLPHNSSHHFVCIIPVSGVNQILWLRRVYLLHKAEPRNCAGLDKTAADRKAASTRCLRVARGPDQLTDSVNRATLNCFPFFSLLGGPQDGGDYGNCRAAVPVKFFGTAM